ncbi:MAG: portal protein [Candidatus Dormibacteria bacterium]
MAQIPETVGPSSGPIPIEQVKSPAEILDESAKTLVLEDARMTRSWINSRFFEIRWIEVDLLYQCPPVLRNWEGTSLPKANISKFVVATNVNAIVNKLVGGLFYEDPPFKLRARAGTTTNTVRSIETIESYELDEMNFRQESKYGLFSAVLNGTGIWKWGWKEYYKTEYEFEQVGSPLIDDQGNEISTEESDKFYKVPKDVLVSRPFLMSCDIRHVLVDPGCRTPDIRDAKFVIHEYAVTYRDLIRMKDEVYYDPANGKAIYRYNLPSDEVIKSWFDHTSPAATAPSETVNNTNTINGQWIQHAASLFEKTTADPLDEPLQILERWDNDKVIMVLNERLVIRNEPNPLGKIPFFSVNWWMIQDCFWGIGLGIVLGGDQRLQQGFINSIADIGTLAANQPIIRSRGANINTQQVRARLGGFIDVDGDPTKALHPMDLPKIQSEMFSIVAASEARTAESSGASAPLTLGSLTPGHSQGQIGRSAAGANGIMAAANDRLGGLVEDFNNQVYKPFLWEIHSMNKNFLPPVVYRSILSRELANSFHASMKDFMTAGIRSFDVLAGAHLAAKQQMAQSLPLLMQYFSSPQLAGQVADINEEYIDFGELVHMLTDSGGWGGGQYYSILKPMTPAMKAKRQANSPAALAQIKSQSDQQLERQKSMAKQEQVEQAWTGRAAGDIIRHTIEGAGLPEEMTGEGGGGPGFGSNVAG